MATRYNAALDMLAHSVLTAKKGNLNEAAATLIKASKSTDLATALAMIDSHNSKASAAELAAKKKTKAKKKAKASVGTVTPFTRRVRAFDELINGDLPGAEDRIEPDVDSAGDVGDVQEASGDEEFIIEDELESASDEEVVNIEESASDDEDADDDDDKEDDKEEEAKATARLRRALANMARPPRRIR